MKYHKIVKLQSSIPDNGKQEGHMKEHPETNKWHLYCFLLHACGISITQVLRVHCVFITCHLARFFLSTVSLFRYVSGWNELLIGGGVAVWAEQAIEGRIWMETILNRYHAHVTPKSDISIQCYIHSDSIAFNSWRQISCRSASFNSTNITFHSGVGVVSVLPRLRRLRIFTFSVTM